MLAWGLILLERVSCYSYYLKVSHAKAKARLLGLRVCVWGTILRVRSGSSSLVVGVGVGVTVGGGGGGGVGVGVGVVVVVVVVVGVGPTCNFDAPPSRYSLEHVYYVVLACIISQ